MPITSDMTFQQIWNIPEFSGWQHMVDYRRENVNPDIDAQTVDQFSRETGWSAAQMLDSLNFVRERCQAGQVFYPLYDSCENGKSLTGLAAFPLPRKSKFAVIVPGGGYGAVCSLIDGYSYARQLNAMGYAAFVVCYRVSPHTQPAPQQDLAQAIRLIFAHAQQWNLDCSDYAVMGFSAGGHLAGSFGTQTLGYAAYGLPKPGTMILCYPVVSMSHPAWHEWSARMFLSEARMNEPDLTRFWSLERQVDGAYPPTYLWQCQGDPAVDVQNSALMAQALQDHGVRSIYEVFPYASHGLPEDAQSVHAQWLQRAVAFWESQYRR